MGLLRTGVQIYGVRLTQLLLSLRRRSSVVPDAQNRLMVAWVVGVWGKNNKAPTRMRAMAFHHPPLHTHNPPKTTPVLLPTKLSPGNCGL